MAGIPTTGELQSYFAPLFELIDSAGEDIVIKENTAPGVFTDHPTRKAKPYPYRVEELIPGSTVKQGDNRLIVRALNWPVARRLEQKDRILWRGREYSVISDDAGAQFSIGGVIYARILQVRG